MKEAVGGAYLYGLIIVFILIMFGFVMATFSYTKAFRVSKSVIRIVENYGGYGGNNSPTQTAINNYLTTIGYNQFPITPEKCPVKENGEVKGAINGICVYEFKDSNNEHYVIYGVTSYMIIDLPLIDMIKVPVYGETEKIYIFTD